MKSTVSDEVRFLIMGDPSVNIIRCKCKYCKVGGINKRDRGHEPKGSRSACPSGKSDLRHADLGSRTYQTNPRITERWSFREAQALGKHNPEDAG